MNSRERENHDQYARSVTVEMVGSPISDLRTENERLRAELAAREWRTIESAPKDGTDVFLMRRDAVGIAAIGAGSWGCRVDGSSTGWISYNRHQWFPQTPTHWAPLPPEQNK